MAEPLNNPTPVFFMARVFTSVFGLGLSPFFPGTVASFAAVWGLRFREPSVPELWTGILISALLCVLLTPVIEKVKGNDPGEIVLDEWAGQWTAFILLPHFNWPVLISGFLIFRIFDILKPLGINRLQKLPGGYGVTADDLLAGVYTAVALRLFYYGGILS